MYNGTIINYSGQHFGYAGFTDLKVFKHTDGNLAFWWQRVSYWNSFEVRVIDAGGSSENRVVGIANSREIDSDKKVTISMKVSATQDWVDSNFLRTGEKAVDSAKADVARDLGSTYTADTWFRATSDNKTVKFYGNSRMMVFRTDGEGGDTGHTGYAFKWTYGGDGTGNTLMLLDNNGNVWTKSYGWLHSKFDTAGTASTLVDAAKEELLNGAIATAQTTADNAATAAASATTTANTAIGRADGAKTAVTDLGNSLGTAAYTASTAYAAASHDHDRLYISDTRGAARAPSYYNDRYAQWDFQNEADTGITAGDSWQALLTVSKWSVFDPSHKQEQLIFTGDDLYRRTATSDTAWGTTKKIWDSGNLNPIVGTSYNSSGDIITYTYADGTTSTIDIVDNNSNTYVTGASFNTADGVLTLTRNSGSVTVDLDGRYESAGAAADVLAELDPRISTAQTTADNAATAAATAIDRANGVKTALTDLGNSLGTAAYAATGDFLGATAKAADADKLDGYDWGQYGKNIRGTEIYADGWLRNYNSGKGLYNQATTQHFYSDDDDYWNVAGGTGANGIRFRDETEVLFVDMYTQTAVMKLVSWMLEALGVSSM